MNVELGYWIMDIINIAQYIGVGVYVGAGPKTLWRLPVVKSTGKFMFTPPNKANYIDMSNAHKADTKPFVMPATPKPAAIRISVIPRRPREGLMVPVGVVNREQRQLRQLDQLRTLSKVSRSSLLKAIHLTVNLPLKQQFRYRLKASSHEGSASSVIPGPSIEPYTFQYAIAESFRQFQTVQLLFTPKLTSLSPKSTNQILGAQPDVQPAQLTSCVFKFCMIVVIKTELEKSAFYKSKPRLAAYINDPAFFKKAPIFCIPVPIILQVQVALVVKALYPVQLYLQPIGTWFFNEIDH